MEKIAKKSTNRIASNSYYNRTKELHKKLDNLINSLYQKLLKALKWIDVG
jgi:hypothetical protein